MTSFVLIPRGSNDDDPMIDPNLWALSKCLTCSAHFISIFKVESKVLFFYSLVPNKYCQSFNILLKKKKHI